MKYFIFILLTFFLTINSHTQSKIISTGDNWEYYEGKESPTQVWQTKTELISGWKIGMSPLGYGNSHIKTTIDYGENENNKYITNYFKKTFRIEKPLECIAYKLGIVKDDGAVVYLNGREIMRINMPDGIVDKDTKASNLTVTDEAENYIHTKILTSDEFVPGINTIAVTLHQGREDSGDAIFNLELTCENDPGMLPKLVREQTIKNLTLDFRIKELQNKLINEKKDIEIELLQSEKSEFKNGVITIAIILILLFSVLIYYIVQQRRFITSIRKKIKSFKKSNFEKSQELMSYSLHSIQNQQLLKETKLNLEEFINDDTLDLKKEVKRLIRQIDYNIEQDDDWLKLMNHFNSIHKGYLERLTKEHPVLSETELRHCVFIKLYMQTKEIAKILHIDPRSVQAARYRIKKKMNLEETIDLRNYLHDF